MADQRASSNDESPPASADAAARSDGSRSQSAARADAGRTGVDTGRPASDAVDAADSDADARPLRIGTYHPKAGHRSAGGVAVYVQEIVRELADDHRAYLYTATEGGASAVDGSGAETVAFEPDENWERLRALAGRSPVTLRDQSLQLSESVDAFANAVLDGVAAHVDRHVDVLFTHNLFDTVLLSNAVSVPVVRVFHGCKHAGLGSRVLDLASDRAGAVANSRQTAREVADQLGYGVDGVAYPGIDLSRFSPDVEPAFETDDPTIVFVGRFVASKGVDDLLDAVADAPVDAHVRLIGRGDEERIERAVAERGLEGAVTIEGEVPHERIPGYYAAADVVCLPTRYESFGMVNLEAMACGRPVVTTDLPGVREYATDGESCLLVPPGDSDALSEALERVLTDADLRERLGREGRRVAENYSWAASAEQLADVARTVVARTE